MQDKYTCLYFNFCVYAHCTQPPNFIIFYSKEIEIF